MYFCNKETTKQFNLEPNATKNIYIHSIYIVRVTKIAVLLVYPMGILWLSYGEVHRPSGEKP